MAPAAERDVVVVGAGNAALCAALSAREHGASVVVLECAPEAEAGGNSRFAGGVMRFAFDGVDDLRKVADLTEDEIGNADFGTYTREQYFDDMFRLTQYRTDPNLVEILVTRSLDTMIWLRSQGARFVPIYGRQAGKVGGRWKFFGGLPIEASGGGAGLVQSLTAAARRRGVEILHETRALSLLWDGARVQGVRVRNGGTLRDLTARAVVLACGGFEANPEWRARYLGPGWELAKVRGTRFNTGDGLRMALDIGASAFGNWSGCHAVGWDRNAPEFGDLAIGDQFEKHSYPLGILVNADGKRFVDEGADFHSFTYAKYGRAVLEQSGQFAWQVFDAKVLHLLRPEYGIHRVTKVRAQTLEELAAKLEDVSAEGFLRTVRAFNAAVREDIPFDPYTKDGRGTAGLDPPKSNWANAIDQPPFEAYATTCGITFTFGGLRVNTDTQVLDHDGNTIAGLHAAGEMVGGIFYFNYPSGAGLVSGAVFGRIAGAAAARRREA
jgi:tricarballylate dehydrogenase